MSHTACVCCYWMINKVVRSGVAGLRAAAPDVEVAGEVADGLAAIGQARQLEPDDVIVDINMPRMNGLESRGG